MAAEAAYLALLLDAPMQSWGFASRFQRRATGLHPTKSGVIGMICAAMGIAKGTQQEREMLPELAALKMTSVTIPRDSNSIRRMEDFHTTGGGYDKKTQSQFIPRKASGGPCDNPTVSRRQYLLDARFGVIFVGEPALVEWVASALRDPVWGVWLGRKGCIPARPLLVAVHSTHQEAWQAILRSLGMDEALPIESFARVVDADDFAAGTDSYPDQPVTFGRADSSSEGRTYSVRRVLLESGS